ncbi:MAG: sigma-54-dependent Fis family transcriptional regulator [Candidatus Schekmanbacteria bacterium]|nr:sigma-54-dependent Fis family transcriptional regulator [Candidatus Schekmanbacteria bacterium]
MESAARVLVIDDEEVVRKSCERVLGEAGYQVSTASGGLEGMEHIEREGCDIACVDLKMPGIDGMEVLRRVRETHPEVGVIIITGYSTVETAVEAMKLGAIDYLCKPFAPDDLTAVIGRAVAQRALLGEGTAHQEELRARYELDNIVGTSRRLEEMFRAIVKVAPTSSTVLIQGESGVGKELVAKAIHFNSLRRDKPFVPVDCAGIPEGVLESELFGYHKGAFTGAVATRSGLLEAADGGTLLLDEIANIPLAVQARLLRVLQEREYRRVGETRLVKADFRLVAATNRDLSAMVKEGRFRDDLYYRLNVLVIRVPPLRERKEDIPVLARHFLRRAATGQEPVKRLSAEAMSILIGHDWPGNVRELANVIEAAVVLGDGTTIRPEHLPLELRHPALELGVDVPATAEELKELKKNIRSQSTDRLEHLFVVAALERNDWNATRAASDVGMQRTNFQALMRKFGIRLRETDADE